MGSRKDNFCSKLIKEIFEQLGSRIKVNEKKPKKTKERELFFVG